MFVTRYGLELYGIFSFDFFAASTKTSTPMASFEASGKERRGAVAVDLTGVMATQLLL